MVCIKSSCLIRLNLTANNTDMFNLKSKSESLNKILNPVNELLFWIAKLEKTSNKVKALKSKINKFNKKHHFISDYFRHIEDRQKDSSVSIRGIPMLSSHELYTAFHVISKEMHLHYRDADIVSIWQTPAVSANKTSHPITVKFKTKKIKNKYINRVKALFQNNKNIKKTGCKVKYLGRVFNVFINDIYSLELTNFLKKASFVASQYGYICYVNNSAVFIRRNNTDRVVLANEKHLDLFKKDKHFRIDDADVYQNNIQEDISNPMMYRRINENVSKAKV